MVGVAPQFLGKKISVTTGGEVKVPVSFRLDDREYAIVSILESWHDYGFGKSFTGRKRWWHRHHRTYYIVKTAEDEVFELYFDRGTKLEQAKRGLWFLSRRL